MPFEPIQPVAANPTPAAAPVEVSLDFEPPKPAPAAPPVQAAAPMAPPVSAVAAAPPQPSQDSSVHKQELESLKKDNALFNEKLKENLKLLKIV
jgi:hypothetical protein